MSRFRRSCPIHESTCCSFSVATDFSWPTTRSCASRDAMTTEVALTATAVSTTMHTKYRRSRLRIVNVTLGRRRTEPSFYGRGESWADTLVASLRAARRRSPSCSRGWRRGTRPPSAGANGLRRSSRSAPGACRPAGRPPRPRACWKSRPSSGAHSSRMPRRLVRMLDGVPPAPLARLHEGAHELRLAGSPSARWRARDPRSRRCRSRPGRCS